MWLASDKYDAIARLKNISKSFIKTKGFGYASININVQDSALFHAIYTFKIVSLYSTFNVKVYAVGHAHLDYGDARLIHIYVSKYIEN